jgi:Pyruvate/2-oxoacid:ferredoxin oxidoreductase delta subunit
MTDVYKKLAEKLDNLPNSFPSTKSGIELKILRSTFTPEEAEMALKISPMPETVEDIAERLEKPVDEMQAILDSMTEKGQVGSFKQSGQRYYAFIPFVIGFAEASTMNRMTPEFAKDFEQYMPDLVKGYGSFGPAETRVVPVSTEIDQELQVHRFEDMRRMIGEAKSFELNECWCRQESEADGRPCKHTKEICLAFSNEENAFDKYETGKNISREEALGVMAKAEEEGLVHLTYNIEDGQVFVCNCCPCCCGLLRGVIEFNAPHMVAKSNFVATIDQESCSACGVCADERCPMEAIVEKDDEYRILAERCIGCGVCAPTCPTESIKLVRKPESEQNQPPAGLGELHMERAANRGIEVN